jgi:uncharacterized protein (TIGR02996 family)
MTYDAEALLGAILAAPDDDAPRLVFADWLEEHGDPARAAFIRAQVELARLPANDRRRPQLVQIERSLWTKYRAEWKAWLPHWAEVASFRRGFVERIRCDAANYIAGADEVRLRTPLTGLRLDGPAEIAGPLFAKRVLEGIRSLTLSVNVPAETWEQFAACPYLGRLEELDLNAKGPAAELVGALLESVSLGALRSLRLKWCALGDEQTARLVRHPWVARLRRLDLSNNHIADEGATAILDSPHLGGLDWLNLRGNPAAEGRLSNTLRDRFGGRLRL